VNTVGNARSMCDWEAEEYAEYLLWVEAEMARVRPRVRIAPKEPQVKASHLLVALPEAAEA